MTLWPSAPFPPSGCPYDFVSLEWLQQWLDESTPPKAIDNTACLCPHGKLHPDKISTVKRVSEEVADYFYTRYGGGPRLTVKALCKDCVVERCRVLRLKSQLSEDYKSVCNLLKAAIKGSDDGFWVGKSSLRSWRQLALEQLDDSDEDTEQSNGKMNGDAKERAFRRNWLVGSNLPRCRFTSSRAAWPECKHHHP
ncbi:ubiquitin carboxyl-terminal hydrolase 48-like [Erythrolamprus reginae]|uniref:ubiquitin carboxyl-terminal hydrolase 48-like n=1 Tax=Erythrolamprus reginae TaxID=121349 RepID=UPI00396CCAE1